MAGFNLRDWNANQKLLRQKLSKGQDFAAMQALLLRHHAELHESAVGGPVESPTYADDLWQGVDAVDARIIPPKEEHSIIWVLWHIARIEDMTMTLLVANTAQVFDDGWQARINAPMIDTGNEITPEKMTALNRSVDVEALRAYRVAVGKNTQALIKTLTAEAMPQKVDPVRIQHLRESGAVVPQADGIIRYWEKRTIAGLLLMPATRHNLIHLNEAARIKKALLKTPNN